MKAQIYDLIQLIDTIKSDFSDRSIPSGTIGTIVECYEQPEEGYAVDLAIPDPQSITGFDYENVVLTPKQFIVLESSTKAIDLSSKR